MKKELVLLADVGGTNIRFGTYQEGDTTAHFDKKYLVSTFKSFVEAVKTYLNETGKKPTLCVIGAAGNIDEDAKEVLTSNTPWRISVPVLQAKLPQFKKVSLDNDFALQGWAIAGLETHQYRSLFGAPQNKELTQSKLAVLGLGTGCGTCLLLKNGETEQTVYTSESGHSNIPHLNFGMKGNFDRDKILKALNEYYKKSMFKGRKGPVIEHIVSGTGLQNVYHALKNGYIPYKKENRLTGYEIEKLAQSGDETALKAFDFLFAYLGAHTGSIASTIKADEIFYCGGLLASSWVQAQLEKSDEFKKQLEKRAGMTNAMKNLRFSVSLYREMAEKGAIQRARSLISETKIENEQKRSHRDLLHAMTTVYALLEEECPHALKEMKKVFKAVEKYKLATQKHPSTKIKTDNQKQKSE